MSTSTSTQSQLPPGAVDITTLPAPHLSTLQARLTSELTHLSTSHTRLRAAQNRFRECISAVKTGVQAPGPTATSATSQGAGGREILVPLTTSLYVPGRLGVGGKEGDGKVIVDVGTGYYVEKTTPDAIHFYTSKITDLGQNLTELERVIQGKSENVRVVEDVLRQKVMAGEMAVGGGPNAAGAAGASGGGS